MSAIGQSYAGLARTITYQPPANLFPGGRTNTETIIRNEPGSLFYPRYNQVDLNLTKNFRYRSKTFSGQIDFFNPLNGNAIFARQDAGRRAIPPHSQTSATEPRNLRTRPSRLKQFQGGTHLRPS